MKYHIIILIFLLFNTLYSKNDTLDTKLKTIEIMGNRVISEKFQIGINTESIDLAKNESKLLLSEVLTTSSSVNIRDYGGYGGIKTVNLRGANSQQTVISIDGISLNTSSNSSIDLSTLPMDLFSGIEVLKSGLSSNFGSGSIGGTINLVTKKTSEYEKIQFKCGLGSYGLKLISSSISLVNLKIPMQLTANYLEYNGEYPFIFNNYGDLIDTMRKNNQFKSLNFSLKFSKLYKSSYLSVLGYNYNSNKGIPGAVLIGKLEDSKTKFSENSYFLLGNYFLNFDSLKSLSIKTLSKYSSTRLYNYQNGSNLNNNEYFYKILQNKLINEYSTGINSLFINIKNEISNDILDGYLVENDKNGKVNRFQISMSSSLSKEFSFSDYLLKTNFGIRYDYFSKPNEQAISYNVGAQISNIDDILEVFLSHSRNFRIPDFYELYYLNYGNNKLKPETSNSYNVGMNLKLNQNLQLNSNVFYLLTKDQIVSVPKNPIMWSAQNFGKVENYGIDFCISLNLLHKILFTDLSYTYQHPIDKNPNSITFNKLITFIPEERLTWTFKSEVKHFSLSSNLSYNSFTFSLPDNSYNSIIPSNLKLDLSLGYIIDFDNLNFLLNFSVKNVTNVKNQIIINYPIPGRNYLFTLTSNFK